MTPATIRRLVTALAAALTLAFGLALAGCGSPAAADVAYQPAVWGPTYQGQVYCGYVYTPAECAGRPGIPMQFPTSPPLAGTLGWALWTDYLTYPSYYHSDRYYTTVIVGRAHYTRVSRTVFVSQAKTFDTKYASAEARYDKAAKYRGSNGKTYTGNKYGSASSKTGLVNRKTTTSGGGNAGSKSDPGKKTTGGSKTTTKTGGGVTRKTGGGTSRYSGGGSKYSGGGSRYSGGGSRSGGFTGGRR